METRWFYMEGDQRRGPMDLEQLVSALSSKPAPHLVPVWGEGMSEWRSARHVPEISQRLPPAPPGQGIGEWPASLEEADVIAGLYRRLVLLVGAQLVSGFFFQVLTGRGTAQPNAVLSLVVSLALIGLGVALAVTAYKLARYLGAGVPILWAVAMFIPCLNILVLLALSSKAQAWCRRYGIKVGFLGPTKESIEEVRRRGVTSTFD